MLNILQPGALLFGCNLYVSWIYQYNPFKDMTMCSPVEEVGNILGLADVVGRIGELKLSLDRKT